MSGFKKQLPKPVISADNARTRLALAEIEDLPFFNGHFIDAAVTTTATEFSHKLGRRWQGYFVTRCDAAIMVFDATSSNDTKYIKLDASGSGNIRIWIF